MKTPPPTRGDLIVLKQILNHIPRRLITKCAKETGVAAKARTFSVFNHLTAMPIKIMATATNHAILALAFDFDIEEVSGIVLSSFRFLAQFFN